MYSVCFSVSPQVSFRHDYCQPLLFGSTASRYIILLNSITLPMPQWHWSIVAKSWCCWSAFTNGLGIQMRVAEERRLSSRIRLSLSFSSSFLCSNNFMSVLSSFFSGTTVFSIQCFWYPQAIGRTWFECALVSTVVFTTVLYGRVGLSLAGQWLLFYTVLVKVLVFVCCGYVLGIKNMIVWKPDWKGNGICSTEFTATSIAAIVGCKGRNLNLWPMAKRMLRLPLFSSLAVVVITSDDDYYKKQETCSVCVCAASQCALISALFHFNLLT